MPALVFVNWYLSKSGQDALSRLQQVASIRRDIADYVAPALKGNVIGGGQPSPILMESPAQRSSPRTSSSPVSLSLNDVIDPGLRGKLDISNAQGGEAPAYHYMGLRTVLPVSYFEQLAENSPMISTGSSEQEQQKLARGEIAAVFTPPFQLTQTAGQYNATLNVWYPDEGTTMLGHSYAIAAQAPRPNIARLFMDYLLSEEGQTQYVTLEGDHFGPRRPQVPT